MKSDIYDAVHENVFARDLTKQYEEEQFEPTLDSIERKIHTMKLEKNKQTNYFADQKKYVLSMIVNIDKINFPKNLKIGNKVITRSAFMDDIKKSLNAKLEHIDRQKISTLNYLDDSITKTKASKLRYNSKDTSDILSRISVKKVLDNDKTLETKLNNSGISSVNDLIEKTRTEENTMELAEKSEIPVNKINMLKNSANMFKIPQMSEKNLELLNKAGVSSTVDMASKDPEGLLSDLEKENQKKTIVKSLPDRNHVNLWIESAKILLSEN